MIDGFRGANVNWTNEVVIRTQKRRCRYERDQAGTEECHHRLPTVKARRRARASLASQSADAVFAFTVMKYSKSSTVTSAGRSEVLALVGGFASPVRPAITATHVDNQTDW